MKKDKFTFLSIVGFTIFSFGLLLMITPAVANRLIHSGESMIPAFIMTIIGWIVISFCAIMRSYKKRKNKNKGQHEI